MKYFTLDKGLLASFFTRIGIFGLVWLGNWVVAVDVVDEVVLSVVGTVGWNQLLDVEAWILLIGRVVGLGFLCGISSPTWKYFVLRGTSFV